MLGKHFNLEDQLKFRVLFVSHGAGSNVFETKNKRNNVQEFVLRALITKQRVELTAEWLKFVKGVVGSEDDIVNNTRETLQQNKFLQVRKKSPVKRNLEISAQITEKKSRLQDVRYEHFRTCLESAIPGAVS